ncbi:hypothetical protein Tco_0786781 [Tanacetum coccineum]
MDPIIPLRQKNTLVEYMILSGADNRPPMLDKYLYDSWKSRMELYMQNRVELKRMILESVENGLEVGSIRRIQGLDTAYWGFLGVGTTFDIFQNIHILFLEYGVLVFWIRRIQLYSSVVFGECRHGYAVSSLMDIQNVIFKISSFKLRMRAFC